MLRRKKKEYRFENREIKPLRTAIGLAGTAVGLTAISRALRHI